ncbi:hypothetical protein [Desertibacillus haloalkaliphilus]|uniref:hypothetical protein n=1 Tax=Desertibacillus haloalkaliphilus TaxID=1328930 RepID=UPI001C2723E3|nr:hypothetical protein [Desertibacillus haloalkaliphilus]MBU8907986.1 hypothetical protein [Desertibacillus haloalkaliphilus]
MIYYDNTYKQILTPVCRECPDDYFSCRAKGLPDVGCCSYSPTFTLFELYKIVKDQRYDLIDRLSRNHNVTWNRYEVIVHANIDTSFFEIDLSPLSTIEQDDLKLQHSVCQFFIEGKGCGLDPTYKTSVCRSFFCTTVEDRLSLDEGVQIGAAVKEIKADAEMFNNFHERELKIRNVTLKDNFGEVINYLKEIH